MRIEQVKLLRTLKSGKRVWVEGSYFPNDEYPSIPHEILMEIKNGTGTVEVLKQSAEIEVPSDGTETTSTSVDVETFDAGRAPLEKALQEEKRQIEAEEIPTKPKRKSKLVRR